MEPIQHVDLILEAKWIITCDPMQRVLTEHALVIDQGCIRDIIPSRDIRGQYSATKHEFLETHALMPGFVNAHTHASMCLMRGIADDLPLMEWLQDHIWPAEAKVVSADYVKDGIQIAMAEMISGGTTCFHDMYFFMAEAAPLVQQAGMRAQLGECVFQFPTAWMPDIETGYSRIAELHDIAQHLPLITTSLAPHSPYATSDTILSDMSAFSQQYQAPIHIHLHETNDEIQGQLDEHSKRPIRRLADLGLCQPSTIAVHMANLENEDITLAKDSGMQIVHCPESNMKLASGICPVQKLLDEGINVALGTDGACSNNDLDMIGEMRSAAFLSKISTGEPTSLNAHTVLQMATINGAKALGLGGITGSLERGKAADIIAIDLDHLRTSPTYDPVATIVYAADRTQVTDVWVGAKRLLKQGKLTTLDYQALKKKVHRWQEILAPASTAPKAGA